MLMVDFFDAACSTSVVMIRTKKVWSEFTGKTNVMDTFHYYRLKQTPNSFDL